MAITLRRIRMPGPRQSANPSLAPDPPGLRKQRVPVFVVGDVTPAKFDKLPISGIIAIQF